MLRRLILALVLLVALVVAGLLWAGRRAASLPDWYRQAEVAGELEPDMVAAGERATQSLVTRFGRELLDDLTADDGVEDESFLDRVKRRGKLLLEGLKDGREVRLEARDLQELILARLADDARGRELLLATRAVRAEVAGGEIELGAVVLPARLPRERLSRGASRVLDRLVLLSGTGDRELYLGVRAVPGVRDGRLYFGPPMRVQVGDLGMSSDLLGRLTDRAELAAGFTVGLGRMELKEAAVEGEELVLTVSPRL